MDHFAFTLSIGRAGGALFRGRLSAGRVTDCRSGAGGTPGLAGQMDRAATRGTPALRPRASTPSGRPRAGAGVVAASLPGRRRGRGRVSAGGGGGDGEGAGWFFIFPQIGSLNYESNHPTSPTAQHLARLPRLCVPHKQMRLLPGAPARQPHPDPSILWGGGERREVGICDFKRTLAQWLVFNHMTVRVSDHFPPRKLPVYSSPPPTPPTPPRFPWAWL